MAITCVNLPQAKQIPNITLPKNSQTIANNASLLFLIPKASQSSPAIAAFLSSIVSGVTIQVSGDDVATLLGTDNGATCTSKGTWNSVTAAQPTVINYPITAMVIGNTSGSPITAMVRTST